MAITKVTGSLHPSFALIQASNLVLCPWTRASRMIPRKGAMWCTDLVRVWNQSIAEANPDRADRTRHRGQRIAKPPVTPAGEGIHSLPSLSFFPLPLSFLPHHDAYNSLDTSSFLDIASTATEPNLASWITTQATLKLIGPLTASRLLLLRATNYTDRNDGARQPA